MPADFPLVSQHPGAMPYHLVRARDPLGGEETWLLTESELARIRERAASKPEFAAHSLTAFTPPMPGWRAALVRWLGGFV